MKKMGKLLHLFQSEGLVNAGFRIFRSIAFRVRGRIFLGNSHTCGAGLRLIGRSYISLKSGCSFGYYCRIEAYDAYLDRHFSPSVQIGRNAHFGDSLHIGAVGNIRIGDDVLFGSRVLVIDHDHGQYSGKESSSPATRPIERMLYQRGDISIGDRVWVGDNAVIFGGADIGEGSVVAAGAFVTGSVPPGSICVGRNITIKKFSQEKSEWERV